MSVCLSVHFFSADLKDTVALYSLIYRIFPYDKVPSAAKHLPVILLPSGFMVRMVYFNQEASILFLRVLRGH